MISRVPAAGAASGSGGPDRHREPDASAISASSPHLRSQMAILRAVGRPAAVLMIRWRVAIDTLPSGFRAAEGDSRACSSVPRSSVAVLASVRRSRCRFYRGERMSVAPDRVLAQKQGHARGELAIKGQTCPVLTAEGAFFGGKCGAKGTEGAFFGEKYGAKGAEETLFSGKIGAKGGRGVLFWEKTGRRTARGRSFEQRAGQRARPRRSSGLNP